jgi:hypothetical protein
MKLPSTKYGIGPNRHERRKRKKIIKDKMTEIHRKGREISNRLIKDQEGGGNHV